MPPTGRGFLIQHWLAGGLTGQVGPADWLLGGESGTSEIASAGPAGSLTWAYGWTRSGRSASGWSSLVKGGVMDTLCPSGSVTHPVAGLTTASAGPVSSSSWSAGSSADLSLVSWLPGLGAVLLVWMWGSGQVYSSGSS